MTSSTSGRGLGIHQQFEQINGSPAYLGTIQSTGTNVISNLSGAIVKGMRLMVQPDAAGYVLGANHATTPFAPCVTQTAANGVKVAADEKFYLCLDDDDNKQHNINGESFLQWISVSGTTNLKVFQLR